MIVTLALETTALGTLLPICAMPMSSTHRSAAFYRCGYNGRARANCGDVVTS